VVIELHQPGHQVRLDGHQPPHGNHAAIIANAEAHAADSLTATQTNALTVELGDVPAAVELGREALPTLSR
jgi:hypothetical protein